MTAIRKDRLSQALTPGIKTASWLHHGHAAAELKAIAKEIDNLVYEGTQQRIPQAVKDKIAEDVAEEIGAKPNDLRISVKAGSNDKIMDVVSYLENILRDAKK